MRLRIGVKAQVSIEMIFAIIIVLLIGVVVGVFALERNNESAGLSESFSSKAECEKLSSIIYSLNVSEAKASVVFSIDSNALISNGLITVGNYYCDFLGNAQDSNLSAGTFKALKNSQGVVVFERQ
jgi:uncharacterized protein (UPF0333 family)